MAEQTLRGLPASPGLAIGCARVLGGATVARETVPDERRPAEAERAHAALRAAAAELEALAERVGGEEAEIIRAGVLMAGDPVLVDDVERAVLDGLPAAAALEAATARHATAIAALGDETLAARAEDVRSLGRRAMRLAGAETNPASAPAPDASTILIADELGPADVAELGPDIAGIALARGGPTAHAAVVARGLGLPLVVGLGEEIRDGGADRSWWTGGRGSSCSRPRPPAPAPPRTRRRPGAPSARRRSPTARCPPSRSTVTACGCSSTPRRARSSTPASPPAPRASGCSAPSWPSSRRETWPTEAQHRAAIAPVLQGLAGRTATVRVLDFGADKTPPFLAGTPAARARAAARPPRRARRPAARDRRRRPRHRAADPAADGRDRRAGATRSAPASRTASASAR